MAVPCGRPRSRVMDHGGNLLSTGAARPPQGPVGLALDSATMASHRAEGAGPVQVQAEWTCRS